MNRIPKCTKKKIIPLKNKKEGRESICGKMKMKILTNKSLTKSFKQDITNNISKNKDNIILTKKSSSYNDKVSQK